MLNYWLGRRNSPSPSRYGESVSSREEIAEAVELLKKATPEGRAAYMDEVLREALPAQIKALRLSRCWSQAEMSEKTGIAQSQISKLEQAGAELPSVATLQKIASTFDVALLVKFSSWDEFVEFAIEFEGGDWQPPSAYEP